LILASAVVEVGAVVVVIEVIVKASSTVVGVLSASAVVVASVVLKSPSVWGVVATLLVLLMVGQLNGCREAPKFFAGKGTSWAGSGL